MEFLQNLLGMHNSVYLGFCAGPHDCHQSLSIGYKYHCHWLYKQGYSKPAEGVL
jgi:hypothetical protein